MRVRVAIFCLALSLLPMPAGAISEAQRAAIVERCDTIKSDLKTIQHVDSRTRVYLGRYYETILTKFITPLNVRLVENNLSDAELINNQDSFAKARNTFAVDFIEYQKALEELVGMDCKVEPGKFYEELVTVRNKRKVVASDVKILRKLAGEQVSLATKLKEKL